MIKKYAYKSRTLVYTCFTIVCKTNFFFFNFSKINEIYCDILPLIRKLLQLFSKTESNFYEHNSNVHRMAFRKLDSQKQTKKGMKRDLFLLEFHRVVCLVLTL